MYRWKTDEEFGQTPYGHRGASEVSDTAEADALHPVIEALAAALRAHELSEPCFAGAYVIAHLRHRSRGSGAGSADGWLLGPRQVPLKLTAAADAPPWCSWCAQRQREQLQQPAGAGSHGDAERQAEVPPLVRTCRVADIDALRFSPEEVAKLARAEATLGSIPLTVARLFRCWQLQGCPQYVAACLANWGAGGLEEGPGGVLSVSPR